MRVLLGWLKEFVDFELSAEELAEKMAMAGIDCESITYLSSGLKNVVVGEIRKIRPHPRADKLVLCDVHIGKKIVQIVCGAKNMKEKDKVAVALPGAVLPGGTKIGKATIRGETSFGMMCSEKELEIGEDHSGILILDEDVEVGKNIEEALGLNDAVIDFEITPNRPDCMGIIGIAREVAAVVGAKFKVPSVKIREVSRAASEVASIKIEDPSLCPRYTARVITDVLVKPSPWWLRLRLSAAGLRPISNVVDVTNYVMLETGQPLHAFDYEKLEGGKIIVRRARKGETLVTLDDVLRQLDESMLVIADRSTPVALAGVMGGLDSEVSSYTKTVLLESAYFNPENIGATARKLGMLSEASSRFERGTDPNGLIYAANRAAYLMQKLAGGKVLKGLIDVYPKKIKPRVLYLRPKRVNEILGTSLSNSEISGILKNLDLKVEPQGKKTHKKGASYKLKVTVPTFRPDLEREIDLIEEVARLYGYNNISSTLPAAGKEGGLTFEQKVERKVKDVLLSCGLYETISYSFINPASLDRLRVPLDSPLRNFVRLRNPVTEDESVMRTTLIPGLLATIRTNLNQGEENIQVFEMGRVFHLRKNAPLPDEVTLASFALTGSWLEEVWYEKERKIDFFDAKGIIETVCNFLGIGDVKFVASQNPMFHPGRGAVIKVGQQEIGIVGELHPDVSKAFGFKKAVEVAELKLESLIKHAQALKRFRPLPRYPGVLFDVAVIVDKNTPCEEIERIIKEAGGKILKEVKLFDYYEGKPIPEGKKSLAYSLLYREKDRTLELEEVKKIHKRVIEALENVGAKIREK